MDKVVFLEQKIIAAGELLRDLREQNLRLTENCRKLEQENEFLLAENQQVRKIMAELDKLREERKIVRKKCEKLLYQYTRMSL